MAIRRHTWGVIWLLWLGIAHAEDLPWTILQPANDGRDAEMQQFDVADARAMVRVINQSDHFKDVHIVCSVCTIGNLLKALTPFAELRIDPLNPVEFTKEEKANLKEWLKRGGFLLCFVDYYPYEQEEFRKPRALPMYDFFTRELRMKDGDFSTGKAALDNPIFKEVIATQPPEPILVEMAENPNFRGYTYVSLHGRMEVFIIGRYAAMSEGRWVPLPRPLPEAHGLAVESYALAINYYFHAMTH